MRISLEIPEPDLQVIAQYLDGMAVNRPVTFDEHTAAHSTLTRMIVQAVVCGTLARTPVVERVFARDHASFGRGR